MPDKHVNVDGKQMTVTNPDKLFFPEISLTKWDYVMHMAQLAPFILPYTRDRLLTVIRFPHGVNGESFYQKNIPDYAPDWVSSARWKETQYILLQDPPTLVWLATQAALEFHVSFHFANNDLPAELVFDLDPSVEGFDKVTEVALDLHQCLQSLGLHSYAKTSGATGIQVYVPIARKYTFDQTRKIGHFLGMFLQEKKPSLVTLERFKKHRDNKVYFDYLQHWHGKTIAAPYSPRAKEHAPVSTPIHWSELERGIDPADFHLLNIHTRLQEIGDLFHPMNQEQQSLDKILHFINT